MTIEIKPDLPSEIVQDLYRRVFLIRRAEEFIIRHYPEDEMKTPMHMSMGHEAPPAAVCAALGERVQVICSYRTHAPFLARVGDLETFFGEMYGRTNGSASGKAGSMHLAAPEKGHLFSTGIVGAGLAPAAGAAFANLTRRTGRIVATFFGDGAMDEGTFWETLNVSSLMGLPVLFVCEDNGYAVHTGTAARRGYSSVEDVIAPYRCGYIRDDSNDPVSLYHSVKRAEAMLDAGRPVFLHAKVHRYLQHVGIGSDFETNYRDEAEVRQWIAERDCVAVTRNRLLSAGVSEADILAMEARIDEAVAAAVAKTRATPGPGPEVLFEGVFREIA